MIQTKLPEISLKVLELPAYLVFALLVLDRALAWTLKWRDRKAEKGCNGKDEKKPTCMESVPWGSPCSDDNRPEALRRKDRGPPAEDTQRPS